MYFFFYWYHKTAIKSNYTGERDIRSLLIMQHQSILQLALFAR